MIVAALGVAVPPVARSAALVALQGVVAEAEAAGSSPRSAVVDEVGEEQVDEWDILSNPKRRMIFSRKSGSNEGRSGAERGTGWQRPGVISEPRHPVAPAITLQSLHRNHYCSSCTSSAVRALYVVEFTYSGVFDSFRAHQPFYFQWDHRCGVKALNLPRSPTFQ